eukprot:6073505-Alexandrium_andersonii.AAC.1
MRQAVPVARNALGRLHRCRMGGRPSRLVHGSLRRWGECPPADRRHRCGAAGRLGTDRASR